MMTQISSKTIFYPQAKIIFENKSNGRYDFIFHAFADLYIRKFTETY